MIIKEAEYKVCGECGRKSLINQAVHGCDYCAKEIEDTWLELTLFYFDVVPGSNSISYRYCSWKCLFYALECMDMTGVSFLDLPTITIDCPVSGATLDDFWEAMKRYVWSNLGQ